MNSMDFQKPKLLEIGVVEFLGQNLKNCQQKKAIYINKMFNIFMFGLFVCIIFLTLSYKYKGKLTRREKIIKQEKERKYIVDKVRSLQIEKQKEQQTIITNLPTFNNDQRIKDVLPFTHPSQTPINLEKDYYKNKVFR